VGCFREVGGVYGPYEVACGDLARELTPPTSPLAPCGPESDFWPRSIEAVSDDWVPIDAACCDLADECYLDIIAAIVHDASCGF
jgi:hypothetical protein